MLSEFDIINLFRSSDLFLERFEAYRRLYFLFERERAREYEHKQGEGQREKERIFK